MTLLVEDGTGVAGANGYVTENELDDYADARAVTLADGDAEAAIVKATTYIDSTYRMRFVGYKTHGRSQGLEWPRTGVLDVQFFPIANNEIPREIKDATCEAAIRELTAPDSMLSDIEPQVHRLQAGSVSIEYAGNSSPITVYRVIDGILSGLLGTIGGFTATAIRG